MVNTQLIVVIAALGFASSSTASIMGSNAPLLPVYGYTNSTDRAALTQLLEVHYSHIVVGGGTGKPARVAALVAALVSVDASR